jgi:hypothetical protein
MRRSTAASLALLCLAVFLAAAHGATILPQPGDVEGCQQAEPPQLVRCAHKPISAFVPNCPFEQVHVSLGVFDPATGTWNATFGCDPGRALAPRLAKFVLRAVTPAGPAPQVGVAETAERCT